MLKGSRVKGMAIGIDPVALVEFCFGQGDNPLHL
jgi:hypothetical protein